MQRRIEPPPVGVAVVGLGWWGRTIVSLLKGNKKLRLVMGVDVAPVEVEGLRVAKSYDEALESREVDAVILCTPHTQHTEQIVQAAAKVKHVFCEKPLSLSRAAVLRAVQACNQNGVKLAVGHEKRFEPPIRDLFRMAQGVVYQTHVDPVSMFQAAHPDVVVDFTNAQYTPALLEAAFACGVRPVIGTSGIGGATLEALRNGCAQHHLGGVLAPNFALGAVVLMLPAARPAEVFALDGLQLGMLAFCCVNTLAAYGSFGEALYHWDLSRVSAVLATAPLFTIGAMWVVERLGLGLVPAEGLNALSIVGALMVVAGSMTCALAARR